MRTSPALLLLALAPLAGCPVIVPVAADFTATLSGDQEVPAVTTQTTADARFFVHPNGNAIDFDLEVQRGDAVLGAAGAHLHCAPEGENGPIVAFLAGEVPGGFDGSVLTAATLTDANIVDDACGDTISDLVDAMFDGRVYVNVHSEQHPAGVVRGQVTPLDDAAL